MNHQGVYSSLIKKANSENRVKGKGVYYERHHILPICLGGLDSKENLVLLTAREHFIAHKLLVCIYPNNSKLWNATWLMITKTGKNRDYRVSSKEYEEFKVNVAKNLSKIRTGSKSSKETCDKISKSTKGENNPMYGRRGGNNPNTGRKTSEETLMKLRISHSNPSEETIEKIRKALTGQKRSLEQRETMKKAQINSDYVATVEHREKISQTLKIAKNTPEAKLQASLSHIGLSHSEETKQKIREANTGAIFTQERKDNISKSLKGRKHSVEEIENNRIRNTGEGNGMYGKKQQILTCPHCSHQGGNGAMTRWHFDNCKQLSV